MPVQLDITPSEFIYDYLLLYDEDYSFVRYKDTVYLINPIALGDGGDFSGIYDTYSVGGFSNEFGLQSRGLRTCFGCFCFMYIGHSDVEVVDDLEYYYGAKIHPSWVPGIHRAFASSSPDRLYDIFEPYFFFYSDKFELICRVAKEGAIFAPEVVPLATEDELIALDVAGAFD
jgi:hypothetical protein